MPPWLPSQGGIVHTEDMLNVEMRESVLHVTLARPEVRNALSDALIGELLTTFTSLNPAVRAVILTGDGSAFCAGGDLEWMRRAAGYSEDQNFRDAYQLALLFEAMTTCKPYVIARVNGHAFGGGAGLVAACDAAIAVEDAKFSFSEVKLGLVPATISRHVIPKIGAGNARWLFASGEIFSAQVARQIGLVHDVTATEEALDERVAALLQNVLSSGPEAVAISKKLAQSERYEPEEGARLLAQVRSTPEAQEGIEAFLNKQKASFVVKP